MEIAAIEAQSLVQSFTETDSSKAGSMNNTANPIPTENSPLLKTKPKKRPIKPEAMKTGGYFFMAIPLDQAIFQTLPRPTP